MCKKKKGWEKKLNGSMCYVPIPYKINGQLVLLISQSQVLTCIWQLASVATLRECWDTYSGIKGPSVFTVYKLALLHLISSPKALHLSFFQWTYSQIIIWLPFSSIFPLDACLILILPYCIQWALKVWDFYWKWCIYFASFIMNHKNNNKQKK